MSDDSADEPHPPNAERVLRRAHALSAVIVRGFLERDAGNASADQLRVRIAAWLEERNGWTELEDDERALVETPLGSAEPQTILDATWRSEGLGVLAWSLGRFELPAHDAMVDPKAASDAVGFLSKDADAPAVLRPDADIQRVGERCLAVHWRFREFSLRRAPVNFEEFSRTCWFGPFDITGVRLVKGDLAVGDCAITEAAPSEVRRCQSISQERHQAANWLLGVAVLYSDVDTST